MDLQKIINVLTVVSLVVGIIVGLFVIAEKYPPLTSQDPPAEQHAAPAVPHTPPATTGSIPTKLSLAPAEPAREKYLLEELEEWWRERILGQRPPFRHMYFRD